MQITIENQPISIKNPFKINTGFTLIELLVALIVGAVLFILSAQSFNYLQRSNARTALTDHLTTAIQYANLVAMTKGKPVYLKPLLNNNWAQGVGLFTALENQLLYSWDWHYQGWQVQWLGFESRKRLLLGSGPEHAASNGHFIIINQATHEHSKLLVNRLGRVVKSHND
jgi:prepilin-type N-terminal cleavage/methylation domain-containing protein